MIALVLGLGVFLGAHSIAIVAPGWRERMVARIGAGPWKGIFSVVSLAGLALVVHGYAAARVDPSVLYTPPAELRLATLALMAPVFPLLLAAYLPGRIRTRTRHPMLLAVKLWALSHLLANGTLADVLVFGGFLAWAVAERVAVARRPARPVPALPSSRFNDALAIGGGLAVYVAFAMWLHPLLIGVAVVG